MNNGKVTLCAFLGISNRLRGLAGKVREIGLDMHKLLSLATM
ncbi:MAG TPA: hypothetical protein VGB84_05365 [Arachidicoccus sp.]